MIGTRIYVIAIAFVAGAFCARIPEFAQAAAAGPSEAASYDLLALDPAGFPSPNPALPNLRTKTLATTDAAVFALSIGTAAKHTHAGTTEVQFIVDGSGTEWIGGKQIAVKPGMLLVIPPNTPHAGFTGGPFRLYTVKTPPQASDDYHLSP